MEGMYRRAPFADVACNHTSGAKSCETHGILPSPAPGLLGLFGLEKATRLIWNRKKQATVQGRTAEWLQMPARCCCEKGALRKGSERKKGVGHAWSLPAGGGGDGSAQIEVAC